MIESNAVESALGPVAAALAADGYRLEVTVRDAAPLRLVVTAGDEACEECLVPKSMMSSMIARCLSSAGLPALDLELVYPPETH